MIKKKILFLIFIYLINNNVLANSNVFIIATIDNEIIICVSAKSFLHNQVRSIVGSLKLVGEGKWEPKKIKEILDKKDRTLCGPVAPAEGLCLEKVDYD